MWLLRKLWAFWKAFGNVLGHVQTTILLSIIYHIGVGPIGLIGRLTRRDLLHLRASQGESFAEQMAPITATIERAEKQF